MKFWPLAVAMSLFISFAIADDDEQPKLIGLRVDNPEDLMPNKEEVIVRIRPEVNLFITLFGNDMDEVAAVLFSPRPDCDEMPNMDPITNFTRRAEKILTVRWHFDVPDTDELYFVCFLARKNVAKQWASDDNRRKSIRPNYSTTTRKPKLNNTDISDEESEDETDYTYPNYWELQGTEDHMIFIVTEREDEIEMPVALQICIIICLLMLSGLFSGLNLGLMSLDQTELKIFMNSGSRKERAYAKKIFPVRRTGNYVLCSILFANVIVNSGISILLDDLTSGVIALICSTAGIVIFGEIVPQSLCARWGLAIGARTIWITKFFMVITAPLSYPTSKLLDLILGKEVGHVYNRERLLELIRLSKDLGQELKNCQEVAIVTGALELSNKTVKDVMTPIREVYMLSSDAILDTKTVGNIVKTGFTRIPIYEGSKDNIVLLLHVKDLILLNPEDKIPLKTVCQFYQHPIRFVPDSTHLTEVLEEFKHGRYHLALVEKVHKNPKTTADLKRELIGIVTLEDVLEEIIQSEISDESDVSDNLRRHLVARGAEVSRGDLSVLISGDDDDTERQGISPQLAIAAYQFLTTSLDPFQTRFMSEKVLQFLIRQNIFKTKAPEAAHPKFLYQNGKPADSFTLILEGRVLVTSGVDQMVFEAGPFFCFGRHFLNRLAFDTRATYDQQMFKPNAANSTFTPDFTAQITKDVIYFQLKASSYLNALNATTIESRMAYSSFTAQLRSPGKSPISIQSSLTNSFEGKKRDVRSNSTPLESLISLNSEGHVEGARLISTNNIDVPMIAKNGQFLEIPGEEGESSDPLLQKGAIKRQRKYSHGTESPKLSLLISQIKKRNSMIESKEIRKDSM